MKKLLCLLLGLCLLLTGCSWMDGNFHSVTVHEAHVHSTSSDEVSAANYSQLQEALEQLISSGREKGIIYVSEYDQTMISSAIATLVRNTLRDMPLAVYAVDDIRYELGNTGGKPAIALEISYLHGRAEILQVRHIADMEAAETAIVDALKEYRSGLVLQIEAYSDLDVAQLVDDFAEENPQMIIEIPQVASGTYPDSGASRILELKFTYRNSREDLREMRAHVTSMFNAAALYVSSDDSDTLKLSHLYSFLMERFDYQLDTSITPAYSLLRHGVGDSKSFATVYSAMCRQAGLECYVVTGTRNGEPWYWNIVGDSGAYYHVDLLHAQAPEEFMELFDQEMTGYVWDYSAYPACPDPVSVASQEDMPSDSQNPTEETSAPGEQTSDENPS